MFITVDNLETGKTTKKNVFTVFTVPIVTIDGFKLANILEQLPEEITTANFETVIGVFVRR